MNLIDRVFLASCFQRYVKDRRIVTYSGIEDFFFRDYVYPLSNLFSLLRLRSKGYVVIPILDDLGLSSGNLIATIVKPSLLTYHLGKRGVVSYHATR